jgi:hypothetical protein
MSFSDEVRWQTSGNKIGRGSAEVRDLERMVFTVEPMQSHHLALR